MNKLCPLSAAAASAAEGEGMRVVGKTKGASRLSAREGGDEAEDKEILPTTRARGGSGGQRQRVYVKLLET